MSITHLATGALCCVMAQHYLQKSQMLLFVGIFSAACILGTASNNIFNKNCSLTRCLTWIGDRSYSIYLLHLPCLIILREPLIPAGIYTTDPFNIAATITASAAMILLCSQVSYTCIEMRFMSPDNRLIDRNREAVIPDNS